MCYTQTASAVLATLMFAVAAYEHRAWHCWHYTLGLIYFGLMEGLQAIQHIWLAVPDDNYSLCESKMNQGLTYVGILHIMFQPLFLNYALMGLFRRASLRDRIESDLIQQLCVISAVWMLVAFCGQILEQAPPATKECPNYNWLRDGYDPALDFTTPNVPGQACTFLSPSEEEHLAWVVPNYYTSYYVPASSQHLFMMMAPYLVLGRRRPILAGLAILMFLTGPIYSAYLTPSINEQAAVWCFASVSQCCALVIIYRVMGVPVNTDLAAIGEESSEVQGKLGEGTIVYQSNTTTTTTTTSTNNDIRYSAVELNHSPPVSHRSLLSENSADNDSSSSNRKLC